MKTPQNVHAVAALCGPKYDKERSPKLINNVGVGGMWIEKLLGYLMCIKFTLDRNRKIWSLNQSWQYY